MKKLMIMFLVLSLFMLTGCSAVEEMLDGQSDSSQSESSTGQDDSADAWWDDETSTGNSWGGDDSDSPSTSEASIEAIVFDSADLFSDRDYEVTYDTSDAIVLDLDNLADITASQVSIDGTTVTILEEGTYIVSGTLEEGQLVVNASSEEKIQIVLDGVSITNSTTAAIYIQQADKVFITLAADTANVINATFVTEATTTTQSTEETTSQGISTLSATDEEEDSVNIDAAIFSQDDLTMNGEGTLTITSVNGNGITSKDDLVITSGTYELIETYHGLEANDSLLIGGGTISLYCEQGKGFKCDELIYIAGGTLSITSYDDAIHSDNDVYIVDGDVEIYTADDGVHADFKLVIDGGIVNMVYCYEGLEGQQIDINGGEIYIYGMDDGINADLCDNAIDDEVYVHVTDGIIQMDTYYEGDGFDSNGSIEVSGGYVLISSTTEERDTALDSQEESIITGGTFIGTGSDGMTTQNFDEDSTQCSIFTTLDSWQSGTLTLTDSSGNIIISVDPAKEYQAIIISSPDLEVGEVYTLTAGDEVQTIDLDSELYGSGGESGSSSFGTFTQPGSTSKSR